jgi:Ca-activated chloride channel family protein
MIDDFERLKEELQRDPPPPDAHARYAALTTAMARFEENNASAPQGIAAEARPSSNDGRGPSAIWSRIMNAMKPTRSGWTPALAGGASLAVLMIAVVSTSVMRPDLFERRVSVAPPLEKPARVDADEAAGTAVKPEALPEENRVARGAENEPVAQPAPQPSPAPMPQAAQDAMRGFGRFAPQSGTLLGYAAPDAEAPAPTYRDQGRDRFEAFDANPVKVVTEAPVSTFSIDVDTASYALMRARLNQGVLQPADSVRVEELINYFPYDYAAPDSADTPFKANVSIMPTPWNEATKLMRIGIKGYVPQASARARANLVFLIDTSGSMQAPDKLPLLRNAFRLLLTSLHLGYSRTRLLCPIYCFVT